MLNKAGRDLIIKNMPTKVTVNGHTINIHKVYANQYSYEQFPSVTLEYRSYMDIQPSLDNFTRKTKYTAERLTYATGTNTYTLYMSYVLEIESVVGIVSGESYTFLDEEYEMTGGTPPFYSQIHFLGPTYPDNGSEFVVNYKHAWERVYVGGMFTDLLIVNIWAKDIEVDKPGGRKENLNGILIADQLAEDFWKWIKFDGEEVIEGIEDTCPLTIGEPTPIVNLDAQVVGEEIRRRQFEVDISYTQEWEKTSVETVEEAEVEINQVNL